MTSIHALDHRTTTSWLTRAITHLALPADKAMDNDSLNAISLLLAKLKEAGR